MNNQKIIHIENNEIELKNKSEIININKKGENEIKSNYEKIKIFSFNLVEKERTILENLFVFEYMGDLMDKINLDNNFNIKYLITDFEKERYNYKIYNYFISKTIIIDFATFLLEFINEDESYIDNNKFKIINDELFNISINSNINKNKKTKENLRINNLNKCNNSINFIISRVLSINESKTLIKLINDYLSGNVLDNIIVQKRSKSADNNIKNSQSTKKNKANKTFKPKDNFPNPINKTYLITREKTLTDFFKLKEKYDGIIIPNYIYDSVINGEFLDLEDNIIYDKYKLD